MTYIVTIQSLLCKALYVFINDFPSPRRRVKNQSFQDIRVILRPAVHKLSVSTFI